MNQFIYNLIINFAENYLHVDIKDSDTSTTITFSEESPAQAPYLIENNTDYPIKFFQKVN